MRQAVLANAAALIGGLLVSSPLLAPLSAQTAAAPAASGCQVDQNKPKELATAWFNYTRAQSMTPGAKRDTLLKQMMRDLVDKPEKFAVNPGGYNYVLSQLYTLMASQPGGSSPTTRGAVGLTTRPTEPFDVVIELNDAFNKMEAASPSCKADIAQSRTNDAWLAITKKAFDAANGGQADTAVYYANRSLLLSKDNPFPHHILATVAQQKNDMATAVTEWKEVVRLAGADTSYRDIKLSSEFYLGVNELQQAAGKTGDAQKTQARSAAGYLRDFLASQPNSGDTPNVMSNLATALRLAGDTAAVKAMYADLMANPSKYSEPVLTMGGVIATQVGDNASAIKLFDGAVKANPNSRDGLRNLAAARYGKEEYDGMFAPLRSLIGIDPNNYDAWMMFAYAFQGIGKAAKDPALRKAYTDSLIKYNTIADSLKAKVEVTGFTRGPSSAEVVISVEQVAATPGNYSVSMEFLDNAGAVVGFDTKAIGPIAKGEKKTVTLTVKGANISAFRYKKLG